MVNTLCAGSSNRSHCRRISHEMMLGLHPSNLCMQVRIDGWISAYLRCIFAFICLICVAGLGCIQIVAQSSKSTADQTPKTSTPTVQILSSYEGQNVTAVEIAGRPDSSTAQFSSLFVQHAGEPFSREKVEQTLAALKSSGKADEVQLQVDPEANGVRVLMILEPAVDFGIFQFPGAGRFPYSQLVQASNYAPQAPYSAEDIAQDRQKLLRFFRQEGYFQAEVQPETKVDAQRGLANILFHVTLNRRARFGNILIASATPGEAAKLDKALQSLFARVHGASIRPGKTYHHWTISRAVKYIQGRLEKQGLLAAQVKLQGAEYHADTNRADIHFDVKAGPLTHVQVEGAHLFSWTRKSLLPVYQGVGVDDESVEEGRQALVSYFQAKGFFDVTVKAQFNQQETGDTIAYQIVKEKKHKVTEVKLSGNVEIAASDLTPHINVQKKHFFSPGKFSEKLVRAS